MKYRRVGNESRRRNGRDPDGLPHDPSCGSAIEAFDIGDDIRDLSARQGHIGHPWMRRGEKIREHLLRELFLMRNEQKARHVGTDRLLVRRHLMAAGAPALDDGLALRGIRWRRGQCRQCENCNEAEADETRNQSEHGG